MTKIEDIQRNSREAVLEVLTDTDFKRIPVITLWLQTRDRFELEVFAGKLLRIASDLAALPKMEVEA